MLGGSGGNKKTALRVRKGGREGAGDGKTGLGGRVRSWSSNWTGPHLGPSDEELSGSVANHKGV